jgi:hypothetical protein
MMNWNGSDRELYLPVYGGNPGTGLEEATKPRIPSIGTVDVLAYIRIEDLTNATEKSYLLNERSR